MDSNAHVEIRLVSLVEILESFFHGHKETDHVPAVAVIAFGKACRNHISIADCLDFFNTESVKKRVDFRKEFVQISDGCLCPDLFGQLCEIHDVNESHGHTVEFFGECAGVFLEFLSH